MDLGSETLSFYFEGFNISVGDKQYEAENLGSLISYINNLISAGADFAPIPEPQSTGAEYQAWQYYDGCSYYNDDGSLNTGSNSAINSVCTVCSAPAIRLSFQTGGEGRVAAPAFHRLSFTPAPFESTAVNKKDQAQSLILFVGGGRWIRTTEGIASRFTVCPLWPLGNSPIFTFANSVFSQIKVQRSGHIVDLKRKERIFSLPRQR